MKGWDVFWLCVSVWNTAWGLAWLMNGGGPLFALILGCGIFGLTGSAAGIISERLSGGAAE